MSNYNAAPGWYPDGQGNQRYWDGAAWSNQVAPLNPAATATPAYPGVATQQMPVATQAPVPTRAAALTAEDLIAGDEEVTSTVEGQEGKVSVTAKRVVVCESAGHTTVLSRNQLTSVVASPNEQGGFILTIQAGSVSKTITVSSSDDAKALAGLITG